MVSQADIHEMIFSPNADLRREAARHIEKSFNYLEDKDLAWKDLHTLAQDEDSIVRQSAANALGAIFGLIPDKDLAWKDLNMLARDKVRIVRFRAADALEAVFGLVPDKDLAWMNLILLAQDEDKNVRLIAAYALMAVFSLIPGKDLAWKDLILLAQNENSDVRRRATYILEAVFGLVPDKNLAWKDLILLAQNENSNIRRRASDALEAVFGLVPDKDMAWKDLIKLARSEARNARLSAAYVLMAVFGLAPDKDLAWKDLHTLTRDESDLIRLQAAYTFGRFFGLAPDKDLAWKDLNTLAQDESNEVRVYAYHSLGRISILKATESDNEFKTHLEDAIESFRRSSEEARFNNPAAFCLPFYQSLHSLLFTEIPREDEVEKYLADARKAIRYSKKEEVLLEAVNNLSKALQEVRDYSLDDILSRKRDLKSYTKYCLQTAECLRESRSKNPQASRIIDYVLVEKSIPIVDQKIKSLFRDVEAAAGRLCKSTKGTDLEAFGRDAYESTKGLNKVESWIAADQYLERIVPLLRRHCSRLPKGAQEHLKTLVDSQDIASLEQRLNTLESVLLASLVQGENDDQKVKELNEINCRIDSILDRFELNERKILLPVLELLNKNKSELSEELETIECLLNSIKENQISRELIEETITSTSMIITEMKSMQIQDSEIAKRLVAWDAIINSPELKIENKIKITIPIIPWLLSYEGAYSFQTGAKLDEAWRMLCARIRK